MNDDLSRVFSAPQWLRDLGFASWLLVGVAAALVGAVWLLSLTHAIVLPVLTAALIASVASPLVGWMHRRGLPRGLGAGILLLAVVVLGLGMVLIIVGGITAEKDELSAQLSSGVNQLQSWAQDLGVSDSSAEAANKDASKSVSEGVSAILKGVAVGIESLTSLAIFLSFTVLSLFFLLKDGPLIKAWGERHMGVPPSVARTVTDRTIGSLRGYFAGVSIVAAFSAFIVGAGALLLGVPAAGTIVIVTFVGGFVPYIGAWSAGAFAVLIALGSEGTTDAAVLAVIVLLANGLFQQMIQPVAYGATLGIHPLAVLIVTIAGGALFGAIGLILSAPLTAAAVKVSADLARARDQAGEGSAKGNPAPASG